MTPRRVMIGGLPYFGRMLAQMLAAPGWEFRYVQSPGRRPAEWLAMAGVLARANLIYLVGGQVERWSRPDWLARFGRRPIVMHWTGTDVSFAVNAARRDRLSNSLLSRPVHWAEVPWEAEELRQAGVRAEVVPLTSARLPLEAPPLPRDFTVLAYLPRGGPEFYGQQAIAFLATALPEVHFLVVAGAGTGIPMPGNVESLGWVDDMAPIYARSSALVRLPQHDGLSFMVIEALAAGRHVIWNHPLGGVLQAADGRQALAHLERLLAAHAAGKLRLNEDGQHTVREQFAPERVRRDILARFERILHSHR